MNFFLKFLNHDITVIHEISTLILRSSYGNGRSTSIEPIDIEQLKKAATMSCVPGATMHNMLFEVTSDDVLGALLTADAFGQANAGK